MGIAWVITLFPLIGYTQVAALPSTRHLEPAPVQLPFEPLDPQRWVNPDNMTWADYKKPPGTSWNDPNRKGSVQNFKITLVAIDYSDTSFVISMKPGATVFGNPQPAANNIPRSDVPAFYRDFLNKPGDLNRGHTFHEYWMEDSAGRFGVELTAFGPYKLPARSWEYGIGDSGSCPSKGKCGQDAHRAAFNVLKKETGNESGKYELIFVVAEMYLPLSTMIDTNVTLFD